MRSSTGRREAASPAALERAKLLLRSPGKVASCGAAVAAEWVRALSPPGVPGADAAEDALTELAERLPGIGDRWIDRMLGGSRAGVVASRPQPAQPATRARPEIPGVAWGSARANGIEFAFLERGSGPLVLCLHGFPTTATSFRHQLVTLADAGCRVVAPFSRGHFPTSTPPDARYGNAALAGDLLALIDALGSERASIVGNGVGAGAAFAAAAEQPRRFGKIVSLSGPYGPGVQRAFETDPEQVQRAWHLFVLALPHAPRLFEDGDFAMVDFLWRTWSPGWSFSEAELEAAKWTYRHPGATDAITGYYRSSASADPSADGPPPVPVPTLYLTGEHNGVLLPEVTRGMDALFPAGLRSEVIPGAGFFVHQERPEAVNASILRFFGEGSSR